MSSSETINFTDVTTAAIVAGRSFFITRTAKSWKKLCKDLDRLAAELKLPLVVVVSTDFSSVDPGDDVSAAARVGLLVAWTDGPEPELLDWDELRTSVDRTVAVPWGRVATLIGPIEFPDSPLDVDTKLWVVPTGPLAGCHVAFGIPAEDESELPAWSPGSPQSIEPKLEYVAGKDMDQCKIDHGVWGMSILYTGDWESELLDISAAEHEVRVALLGSLTPRAGYYLMASYD
jgi:hypothetical protein